MVNNMGNSEYDGLSRVLESGVLKGLKKDAIIQDPNFVNLKTAQEQADATRVRELRAQIASGEGTLGSIARIGVGMSIVPDSIDEVGPRHEYTKEDAQRYLDELNKKYPIKQVLGEYYDEFVSGKLSHIFQMSFTGDAGIEAKFYELVKKSAENGKWVGNTTHKWSLGYIRDIHPEDVKTKSIIENNALGFYEAYPEAQNLAEEYREIVKKPNSWGKFAKLVGINFRIRSLLKKMDSWSGVNFSNRLDDIINNPDEERNLDMPVGVFPKEHLIQDLMRRLKTSIGNNLQIEQK